MPSALLLNADRRLTIPGAPTWDTTVGLRAAELRVEPVPTATKPKKASKLFVAENARQWHPMSQTSEEGTSYCLEAFGS